MLLLALKIDLEGATTFIHILKWTPQLQDGFSE